MADAWSSFNVALCESFHHVCANTRYTQLGHHSFGKNADGQCCNASRFGGEGHLRAMYFKLVRSSWRVVSASPRVLLKLERASNRNSYCQTSIDYLLRNGTHWKRLRGVFLSRAAYRQHQTLRTHLQHPRSKFVDRRKHLHHSNQLNMPQNDFDRARVLYARGAQEYSWSVGEENCMYYVPRGTREGALGSKLFILRN